MIIPQELAADVLMGIDEEIILEICKKSVTITPEQYRESVWEYERFINPTLAIRPVTKDK